MLRRFLVERGVAEDRIRQMEDAILFHMSPLPRWSKGPIAGLLQVGAWMDVMRLRRWGVSKTAREIDAEYPRLGFDLAFPGYFLGSLGSFRACLGLIVPTV